MSLIVKMDGNSRLAKQYRFANAANTLADKLDRQQRIHLIKDAVVNANGRTDALGRVLENLKAKPNYFTMNGHAAVSQYLGISVSRLPRTVVTAIDNVSDANDSKLAVQARRNAIAAALLKLARAMRNARIGRAAVV